MSHRILIVEDNKTLAKLISKKIENSLDFTVDIAYTLKETKLFLSRYKYFITLLDLNLPDAPDGEVVDYALSKGNHVIVLSANINKNFRAAMLKKNIIDYVNKGGINDINYIIHTITRLQKNQEHTILVVDDSMVFRKHISTMLKNLLFKVITVAHGEEALNMLKTHQQISLVLTDYFMPVMDGLTLTHEIRKTYSKNDLCILALSSSDDDEVSALFLKQGANDYIQKPFSKEEFSCRINNSIEALENIQIITNHANRDFLTGLYNRRYFFNAMDKYLQRISETNENYAVAMLDLDNFKAINDTYGHDIGDEIIIAFSQILMSRTDHKDIIARFGGEEFCLILKDTMKAQATTVFENILNEVRNYSFEVNQEQIIKFTVSIGACMGSEGSLQDNINQSDMMLYNAKNSGKDKLVFT